jgi:hypothetical protein
MKIMQKGKLDISKLGDSNILYVVWKQESDNQDDEVQTR